MKRITAHHSNTDRIVCITTPGKHEFFYQPVYTKDRYWLFNCEFSGSVFAYFRDYGREFSLTIREIYRFKNYWNPKLVRLMERIPSQIEYVIRERTVPMHTVKLVSYNSKLAA